MEKIYDNLDEALAAHKRGELCIGDKVWMTVNGTLTNKEPTKVLCTVDHFGPIVPPPDSKPKTHMIILPKDGLESITEENDWRRLENAVDVLSHISNETGVPVLISQQKQED